MIFLWGVFVQENPVCAAGLITQVAFKGGSDPVSGLDLYSILVCIDPAEGLQSSIQKPADLPAICFKALYDCAGI